MHNHHKIPKHMGGSDSPTNIEALTVTEHAQAHKELYEKYGKKEDKCAWLGLSKQIGQEEIWMERSSMGGENNKGVPKSKEHKHKISEALRDRDNPQCPPEVKSKISKSMVGNTNSKNHYSDEYKKKQSESMKAAWKKRKGIL